MYNKQPVDELVRFIYSNNGKLDKNKLQKSVQKQFNLTKDRSIFYNDNFALRFSSSKTSGLGNTVLSLSALQKYDNKPVILCIVTPPENYLLLINSTCITKISHSSQQLRMDNIKGSFNGSDIMRTIEQFENNPNNFSDIFAIHSGFTFEDNLERLVEKTNNIQGTIKRFEPSEEEKEFIYNAPMRAKKFVMSDYYNDLNSDLNTRTNQVKDAIAVAAFIENVNIRGRLIEYLITSDNKDLKHSIVSCLMEDKSIPHFITNDSLGDYTKNYRDYLVAVDIKTKVLFLDSNPKAYNIEKFLRFIAQENTIYMIFMIGLGADKKLITKLCSVFQSQLIEGTNIMKHWSGRNSRGVTQFLGKNLVEILYSPENSPPFVDIDKSSIFLTTLLNAGTETTDNNT